MDFIRSHFYHGNSNRPGGFRDNRENRENGPGTDTGSFSFTRHEARMSEGRKEITNNVSPERIAEIKKDCSDLYAQNWTFNELFAKTTYRVDRATDVNAEMLRDAKKLRHVRTLQGSVDEMAPRQKKLAKLAQAQRELAAVQNFDGLKLERTDEKPKLEEVANVVASGDTPLRKMFTESWNEAFSSIRSNADSKLATTLDQIIGTADVKEARSLLVTTLNENLLALVTTQNQIIDTVNAESKKMHMLISAAKIHEQGFIDLSKKVLSTIETNDLQQDRKKFTYQSIADELPSFSPPPLERISDKMKPKEITDRIIESKTRYTEYQEAKDNIIQIMYTDARKLRAKRVFLGAIEDVFGKVIDDPSRQICLEGIRAVRASARESARQSAWESLQKPPSYWEQISQYAPSWEQIRFVRVAERV